MRPHQSYVLQVGSQNYKFFMDCPVQASREVAQACLEARWHGKRIFDVAGLESDPDEDVEKVMGVQLKFDFEV